MAENIIAPTITAPTEEEKNSSNRVTLDDVVSFIKSGTCRNVITLAGAGVSASARIPKHLFPYVAMIKNAKDFDVNGELSPDHLDDIMSIEFYKQHPKPFLRSVREFYSKEFQPTPANYFIKLLHEKGILVRNYTKNVDGLDILAGTPAEKVVELYGTLRTARCLMCRKEYTEEWMKNKSSMDSIPACSACEDGVVKPDMVFIEELFLPRYPKYEEDCQKCDLLIIIGTFPIDHTFKFLIDAVPVTCPRILINSKTFETLPARNKSNNDQVLETNLPNLIRLIGDCDEMCIYLAEKLGWKCDIKSPIKDVNEVLKTDL